MQLVWKLELQMKPANLEDEKHNAVIVGDGFQIINKTQTD